MWHEKKISFQVTMLGRPANLFVAAKRLCKPCTVTGAIVTTTTISVNFTRMSSSSAATSCTEQHASSFSNSFKNEPASMVKVASKILSKDAQNHIVFVGERHDDTNAHRCELALLKALHEGYIEGDSGQSSRTENRKLILSLEFFDTDTQLVLDEYLRGLIPVTPHTFYASLVHMLPKPLFLSSHPRRKTSQPYKRRRRGSLHSLAHLITTKQPTVGWWSTVRSMESQWCTTRAAACVCDPLAFQP